MLELKNLKKVYVTKGNVEVRALDDVSIKFPETGMIFLLGKSGSGKSTLLNVTGGLDKPDEGEIIVKGRSSKDFTSADFDSYRNTFIGFIFQEYNVLGEFTVEDNIGLALELQGKSKDKKAIAELLAQVDLEGLGKRKPSTLSGGQKQRVAIARALIKNPEIIMADEPTGSLDSNTGKQVFDTLKKLSKEKLVIVVSHDREFANTYADRIIELKDGKIISDVSRGTDGSIDANKNVLISDGVVSIKNTEDLTEEDVKEIVTALKSTGGEAVIATSKGELNEVKRLCKINDKGEKETFSKTRAVKAKEYDGTKTKFIKSKLPMNHALRIGASSLKVKPLRLLFTVLLSVVAFTLFGVLSTMMMYNPNYSIAMSLKDSMYTNIALTKTYDYVERTYALDDQGNVLFNSLVKESAPNTLSTGFSKEEIENLNNNEYGLEFAGIFSCGKTLYKSNGISDIKNESGLKLYPQGSSTLEIKYKNQHYYARQLITGFTDCGAEYMQRQGYTLHGRYPENASEIAIPEYLFRMMRDNYTGISNYDDILGREFRFDKKIQNLKVVGVYEIPIDDKYEALKVNVKDSALTDNLRNMKSEFYELIGNSFNSVVFVTEDFYNKYSYAYETVNFDSRQGLKISPEPFASNNGVINGNHVQVYTQTIVNRYKDNFVFYGKDGKVADFSMQNGNEVYLPVYFFFVENNYVAHFESCGTYNTYVNEVGTTISGEELVAGKAKDAWYRYQLPGGGYKINPYYAEYHSARQRYMDTDRNYFDDEVEIIFSTIVKNYNAVTGENLFDGKDFMYDNYYAKNTLGQEVEFEVVGYYSLKTDKISRYVIFNEDLLNTVSMSSEERMKHITLSDEQTVTSYYRDYHTDYDVTDYKYDKLITKSDNQKAQTMFMLESAPEFVEYHMTNKVYQDAYSSASLVAKLKVVFLVAGLVAGFISAFMLLNFVAVSISIKRKEIGVLRAVGARSMDVFKIFFAESLIIVLSCFLVASVAGYFACDLINSYTMNSFISIKLFNYGILSVLMIFVISVVVAFIATYLPVRSAAKKPPVDSMREL